MTHAGARIKHARINSFKGNRQFKQASDESNQRRNAKLKEFLKKYPANARSNGIKRWWELKGKRR